jgi:aminopeptidase N
MASTGREFLGCGRRLAAEGSGPGGVQRALLGVPPVYTPDRPFDTCHIYLDLRVDFALKKLSGFCRTSVKPLRAGLRSLSFNAVDLKVSKVLFDGKPVRFKNGGGNLRVTPPKALIEGDEYEIEVRYSVKNPESGLHFVNSPPQMWSQSQPEDARRWFPCHDTPGEKTTSEVRATVPKGFRAVSNGVLVEESPNGKYHTWHWKMDHPHSIYLITLAVARFAEIVEEWDGIPIVYYCEKGREADAKRGFGKTAAAMKILSEKTGVRYPYPRYAQVAVAEYPGGMEHTTATTQTDACLIDKQAFADHDLDTLVAHELAHQWFGDLVTCTEWPHAWLNEGFATYCEVVFLEADRGHDEALYELLQNRRIYLDEGSGRYRRAIVCRTYTDPWTLFDRHLYEKGSWVLRMLHLELGDQLFWKGVKLWLTRHRDGIAETQDLVAAFEDASGRGLQSFFDQWVYRAGHPALRLRWSWDTQKRKGELHVTQTQDVSDAAPAYKLKAKIRVVGRGWTRDFTETLDAKEHRFLWTLPGEPLDVEFDPDLELLASIQFSKPQAYWLRQLRSGLTSVSRLQAASHVAAWGGEKTIAALEAAALREKFWGASVEMVSSLGSVSGQKAVAALRRLLNKLKNSKVRRAVIAQLGARGGTSDARTLAPIARTGHSLLERAEATVAVGRLDYRRNKGLIEKNIKATTYRDGVAAAAVSAVAASRDAGAGRRLLAALKPSHSYGARVAAIRGLAEYASALPEAVPALIALLDESDERISLVACAALGRTGDERALPALGKAAKSAGNPRIRVYATESVARIKAGSKTKSKLVR